MRYAALIAASVTLVTTIGCAASTQPTDAASPIGDRVVLATADGGTLELRPGTPALVAWLGVDSDSRAASRRQVAPLESVARQYSHDAVQVLLIATALDGELDRDAAVNAHHDWHATPVPLALDGQSAQTARQFGVTTLPTVVLLDADGTEARRWNQYVPPGELATSLLDIGIALPQRSDPGANA